MKLREYEIELLSSKIGTMPDDKRVIIKVGKLRALIERNSVEADKIIDELKIDILRL